MTSILVIGILVVINAALLVLKRRKPPPPGLPNVASDFPMLGTFQCS
ncbi:MAG: hypothetical protein AAFU49_04770 [Pseudomonadota bacterium]